MNLNYSYAEVRNRVKQVAGSSAFTHSYQGLNILYEKNVTGSTTTVTKHFYADGLQVAKMVGSTVYYLHEDALGSVRLVATEHDHHQIQLQLRAVRDQLRSHGEGGVHVHR